jgi:carbon-monoxide dehydrogenase iron sulfur subunit
MKLIVVDSERCVGCQSCMFACARRHQEAGLAKSCIGVHSSGGMERGFNLKVCRACEDPPCLKMCPTGALRPARGGGVRLDLEKCHGCGNCRSACLLNAIFWNSEINKPMICSHCGYCAKFCPHGVIAAFKEEEAKEHAL